MALTDFSDVFASVRENAFNNIVLQLQRQRPSLFNYGTQAYVLNPKLLSCADAPDFDLLEFIDKDVINFKNPVIHKLPLLAIPGYAGPFGLEYSLRLGNLSIDFFPGNMHALPPELYPLPKQCFSLRAQVCVSLGCASMTMLKRAAPQIDAFYPELGDGKTVKQTSPKGYYTNNVAGQADRTENSRPPKAGLPFEKPLCFCLDLYSILKFEREGATSNPVMALRLNNLEITDIKPNGLESIAECFLRTFLMLSVLPKIKLALNAMIFRIANVLTVQPTPVSANVPFNPAVEDDQVKIFINLSN